MRTTWILLTTLDALAADPMAAQKFDTAITNCQAGYETAASHLANILPMVGPPLADAGMEAGADAGSDANAAIDAAMGADVARPSAFRAEGGCGCTTVPTRSANACYSAGFVLALAVARRRRRDRARELC